MKMIRENNSHRGLKFGEMVPGGVYENSISGIVVIKTEQHLAVNLASGRILHEVDYTSAHFVRVEAELIIK